MSQDAPAIPAQDTALSSEPPSQTLARRLDAAEELWAWKLGLRALLVIVALIGLGCMGWAVSTSTRGPYGYDDSFGPVWPLITFAASAIWCTVCILVLLLRRPNAPVHPGVAVGIDLVLWLAFIPTALLALLAALSVLNFGADDRIGKYSSFGEYELAPNGTWVWHQTDYDAHFGRTRDCTQDGAYRRYDGYGFESCAEEDAYVNALWGQRRHRANVEMTGAVCQFIGLLLHLALFIWACVDTHRRKRRKVSSDAQKLASDIVMNMIRTGAVVPVQNQGEMGRPLLYHQQPQGWAPQSMPPQQQPPRGWPAPMLPPQPVVLGPEKGDSARFA